jgi:hypothetical protein
MANRMGGLSRVVASLFGSISQAAAESYRLAVEKGRTYIRMYARSFSDSDDQ